MNRPLRLPESVDRFINQRKAKGGISAVLLYGSYARGTQHRKSDVDIIFVVDQGFSRHCVVQDGILFEVIEQTKSSVYSFWQKNLDEDRHWNLWKDTKILYDRDGEGKEIIAHALSLVGEREPWTKDEINMRRLIMKFKIENIRYVSKCDACSATLLLIEFVRTLIENWFGIRGQFIPSSKEIFHVLSIEDPLFAKMLNAFYIDQMDLESKLSLADNIFEVVYQ